MVLVAFVLAIEETMVPHPGGPLRTRKSLVMKLQEGNEKRVYQVV